MIGASPTGTSPKPLEDEHWRPLDPARDGAWDQAHAVHLHRRALGGADIATIRRSEERGLSATVDALLDVNPDTKFEALSATLRRNAINSDRSSRIQAWWLHRMLCAGTPLRERAVLMWHDHFATSMRKVRDVSKMIDQNEILRGAALGPFGDLLRGVLHDPAMLVWLDANHNKKGRPNENLARELMELFTLGIGEYREHDVKEAARALTGWSALRSGFRMRAEYHDHGEKEILGQRGAFSGDELVDVLLEHPACGRRIAWRLCRWLMGEEAVDAAALAELGDGLQRNNLDLRWALRTVLSSARFYASSNVRARISSPVEFVVGTLRALELRDDPPSTLVMAQWAGRMGQELFFPPNVGGWRGGQAWLSTRGVFHRVNFAAALVRGELSPRGHTPDLAGIAERAGIAGDLATRVGFFSRLLLGRELDDESRAEVLAVTAGTDGGADPLAVSVAQLLARPEALLV